MTFALQCYPDRLDYVDNVLGFSAQLLTREAASLTDPQVVSLLVQLLTVPLENVALNILRVIFSFFCSNAVSWHISPT